MQKDFEYDKIRIKHDLSRLEWFLVRHAIPNADQGDKDMLPVYRDLEKTVEDYISKIS